MTNYVRHLAPSFIGRFFGLFLNDYRWDLCGFQGFPPEAEFQGMLGGMTTGGLPMTPPTGYIQSGCRDTSSQGLDWSIDYCSNGSVLNTHRHAHTHTHTHTHTHIANTHKHIHTN